MIASTDAFGADVFRACPQLRLVARVGVGYDAIDVAAATAAGVAVTTTPGTNASSVADHALALMLAVLRRVAEHDAAIRAGGWPRGPADLPGELTGRTVGLVGYGRIGRLVGAARCTGFDAEVLAFDPALRRRRRGGAGQRSRDLLGRSLDRVAARAAGRRHAPSDRPRRAAARCGRTRS